MALSLAACGQAAPAASSAASASGSSAASGSASGKTYNVGIIQLVQHPALDAATKGFQDALTDALGDAVHFDLQNAAGDSATCSTMQPEAKTIGILYTTSEPNSVSTIAEYKEKAGNYGFTIDAVGVTTPAEVPQGADTLISHKVDCFSNLTDNNVVGVLSSVLEKTNEAGIPVYGSEIEQVKIGCVAAAGIDYVQLGKQTGAMKNKTVMRTASTIRIVLNSRFRS